MTVPYAELFAGTAEVTTTLANIGGLEEIPALTPLMLDVENNRLIVWDGVAAGTAVCLTAFAVNPVTQPQAQVYKTGTFNIDVINWPESVADEALKLVAFVGSALSVQPLRGEE